MTAVRWVTAFLDTAIERSEESEQFWCAATGQVLSAARGGRGEFATLLPDDGDPFLRVQRVGQSSPGGLHLDLHTDDVDGLATRAETMGATASYPEPGLVVLGSPGGMSFCIVDEPGGRRPSPQPWPGGRSLVDQVCLDIPPGGYDQERDFWVGLTGWRLEQRASEFDRLEPTEPMPLHLLLQRLDDEQPVVTCHLDIACDDVDAERRRHAALGAREVRRTPGWVTLADPTGREYCLTHRSPDTGRG